MSRDWMSGSGRRAVLLSAAGLALAACDRPAADARHDDSVPVATMTVAAGSASDRVDIVGTVRYRQETPLGFTTPGKVTRVTFEAGDRVQRGSLLAALDPTVTGGDLAAASAEATRARADAARMRDLFAQGWITRPRLESAEAAAKAADARVAQAGFASATTTLTAPSAGIVLAKFVQPGQVLSAGTAALILGEADSGFVFRAPVVDRDASQLAIGGIAEVRLPALGDAPVQARISEIDGRANETTGAFTVQLQLPADARLRSGMIGSARLTLPPRPGAAIEIPASAVTGLRSDEGTVFVLDPRAMTVQPRSVAVSRVGDRSIAVARGLSPGETIVTTGVERLKPGAKVRAVAAPR